MSDIKTQIIENVDIVSSIEKYVKLESKGQNYVGLCPFHQDNNPSFTVSPEKKIYKCFVCGEGGNVITFMQRYNDISYQEAIKRLAKENSIKYVEHKNYQVKVENELLSFATQFYQVALISSEVGSEARNYLKNRNITDEVIKNFSLGYAPKNNELFTYYEESFNEDISLTQLDNTSLFVNDKDFFKDRLMFPIKDDNGLFVGYSGRILSNSNGPKYLNSKNSQLFDKSNILYNLDIAKNYIKDNTLYIVEGFFDVIRLNMFGLKNVVATMGTAFSNNHIKLLNKYRVNNIVLMMDQDNAGKESMIKIGKSLLENNFKNIHVVVYSNHKDVDEYLSANNNLDSLLKKQINFFEFKIDFLQQQFNLNDIEQRAKYINEVMYKIELIDINIRNLLLQQLSSIVKIDASRLSENINNITIKPVSKPKKVVNGKKTIITTDDDAIIKFCLISSDNLKLVNRAIENGSYRFKRYNELFVELKKYYENNEEFDIVDYIDEMDSLYFEEIEKIMLNNFIDVDKVQLILSGKNKKKKLAASNILRRGK